jgi:4-hydroxybenzoyl-CoA thioesterase
MSYRTRFRIRFGDVDSAGIVYYPRYLHFCHVAMEEFFREALGRDYAELITQEGFGLPTVQAEAEFHHPLRYGDEAEMEVALERLGGTSVVWRFTLYRVGRAEPVARARIVTVALDLRRFEKVALPPWLRAAAEGHLL